MKKTFTLIPYIPGTKFHHQVKGSTAKLAQSKSFYCGWIMFHQLNHLENYNHLSLLTCLLMQIK